MDNINPEIARKYEIIREIGATEKSRVYLVKDRMNGLLWALKQQTHSASGQNALDAEILLLQRLQHPSIPVLHESFRDDHATYMIMEYVEGKTLKNLVEEKGHLSEQSVLAIFTDLCRVLIYLHSTTPPVVYRDMKPGNIMLQADGTIRLIDFDISREYRDGASAAGKAWTKGYAAPEQYEALGHLDVRTDIYSLGATMHYLITGKNPRKPPYGFAHARSLQKNISLGMDEVLHKCLQFHPAKRYQSADELLAALEDIPRRSERLRKRSLRHRIELSVAGIVLVLLLGGVFTNGYRMRHDEVRTYYELLEQAGNEADDETAQALFDRAIRMDPGNPEGYLQKAERYAVDGQDDLANAYIEDEIMPKFPKIKRSTKFARIKRLLEDDTDK